MGNNNRKRNTNHKKKKQTVKVNSSDTTQATRNIDTQNRGTQQTQAHEENRFSAQEELYKVENQQYELLTKLFAFLLTLYGIDFFQKSILSKASAEEPPYIHYAIPAILLTLLATYALKLHRVNQIQKGMARDINNFYTNKRTLRAFKTICGPGKYEHNAALNLWQKRLKRKGAREGLSNPEIVSEIGSRYASWLGLAATFFGLVFPSVPQLASYATAALLFASAVFTAYTFVYFKASNQHLVNQILRHETQQC